MDWSCLRLDMRCVGAAGMARRRVRGAARPRQRSAAGHRSRRGAVRSQANRTSGAGRGHAGRTSGAGRGQAGRTSGAFWTLHSLSGEFSPFLRSKMAKCRPTTAAAPNLIRRCRSSQGKRQRAPTTGSSLPQPAATSTKRQRPLPSGSKKPGAAWAPGFPSLWSQRQESNPQPSDYKSDALPLSHAGI